MATAVSSKPSAVRGRTIRWTFADGPTAGTTFEHEFRHDGTVVYRSLPDDKGGKKAEPEPIPYRSARVADDVHVVSYKAPGGYTLTVVLNFAEKTAVGFASNEQEWVGQTGTFEVVA